MDDVQFQRIARALADPHRRQILEILAKTGELSCGGMVGCVPLSQATVSHHLKELVEAGLLRMREERQYNYYAVQGETVDAYMDELRRRLLPAGKEK